MKRGNTDCRRFQKRRDWIRQHLKFTVKIIFFDAAIGSKNYALQEYLSKDSGQPIGLYYGGPYLQTQQTILETQHNIFETQHKIIETQHDIIQTKHNTKLSKHNTILAVVTLQTFT